MLTSDDVQTYRERGYVTLSTFFTDAELAPIDAFLAANSGAPPAGTDPLREPHYANRSLFDFATTPRLLDRIEALIGPDIVLLYTHLLNKKPGGLGVAWHQDGPYWPRIEPKVAVTAWVPLDDADRENGCMRVIPGSHRGDIDYGQRQVDRADLIQQHAVELPPDVVDESKAEDVILKPGDLSLHHSYIIHGSQPNHSKRRRAALTIRYVPSATRITPREDRRQYLVRGRAADNGNIYFSPPR